MRMCYDREDLGLGLKLTTSLEEGRMRVERDSLGKFNGWNIDFDEKSPRKSTRLVPCAGVYGVKFYQIHSRAYSQVLTGST